MRRYKCALAVSVFTVLIGSSVIGAFAEEFPNREIRYIVPYGPGAIGDIGARLVAAHMSQRMGQPVVVENIVGASGLVGTTQASLAPADGYTIVLVSNIGATFGIFFPNMEFDLLEDFDQISTIASAQLVLITPPDSEWETVEELIAYAKANPGAVSYAHAGEGSSAHLSATLFQREAGIELYPVAYSTPAQAQTDLLAGRVDLQFTGTTGIAEFIRNGDVQALGLTGRTEAISLPGVPSISETVPTFEMTNWQGLMVPAGTPQDVVARLNEAVHAALSDPDVVARLNALDTEVIPTTPAEADANIEREINRWETLLAGKE